MFVENKLVEVELVIVAPVVLMLEITSPVIVALSIVTFVRVAMFIKQVEGVQVGFEDTGSKVSFGAKLVAKRELEKSVVTKNINEKKLL